MEMCKVNITVLKKVDTGDIRKNYGNNVGECDLFKEGDQFISEGMSMPQGFCAWAWADIQRDVVHLALNGSYPWMKTKGTAVACCTDGLRPVVFKLERVE
jgi:uncharacterized repeat protein (TIGR04076 family)